MLRPGGIVHVVPGQQDLGHGLVILGKKLIENMGHAALSHGGGCLLHPQFPGPLGKAQPGGSGGNGPGEHQDNLAARPVEIR